MTQMIRLAADPRYAGRLVRVRAGDYLLREPIDDIRQCVCVDPPLGTIRGSHGAEK